MIDGVGIRDILMAIGDLHTPFEHPHSWKFLDYVNTKYVKPHKRAKKTYLSAGDEADKHGLGNWDSNPDGMSAGDEYRAMIKSMKNAYALFPNMYVCTSNHTSRGFRVAFKAGLPKAYLKPYREMMQAPIGWQWKDRWIFNGILFEHGEQVSGMYGHVKAARENMMSTCIGHLHCHAGISYLNNVSGKQIFGFNLGCLVDVESYAMEYARAGRVKPVLGVGLIINGVPHFIPMILDKKNRWIGK